jgi:hypothetical protein
LRFVVEGGSIRISFLLALLIVIQPGSSDPRAGNWTLVSAQSSLDPPNRLTLTPLHGAEHVVMSGKTRLDVIAKPNGQKSPAPGNLGFDQIELHRIDKRQAEVLEEKNGAVVATVHEKLSPGGNELISTTVAPGHPDQVSVWVRTGGAKVARDPFAGEWTEDLSKTRMRQGLMLKIDTDASDAVHFQGDYSYTARFDGKQYDLVNSPNDTVVMERVDDHTVDCIYRRDDQITQKDRWILSADGQQLTLTTTGTLETGQQLHETLLFKKQ